MPKIFYASGHSVTLSIDREKIETSRFLSFVDVDTIKVNKTSYLKVGNAICVIDEDININWSNLDTGSEENGKDYFVYVCIPSVGTTPVIKISANATYPQGYTSDNSRKIGGFHNNPDGDILERSMWDLDFRPACPDPTCMVYDPASHIWVDIYLPSDDGNDGVQSQYGASILKTTWNVFVDKGHKVCKRLLRYDEFMSIAAGGPEQENIAGGSNPGTTGGHTSSGGVRIKSTIGVEDAVGVMYQAGLIPFYILEGTDLAECKAWNWYDPGLGQGHIRHQGSYGVALPQYGGYYASGENSGSRCLDLSLPLFSSSDTLSARFCCDPLIR